MADWPGDVLSFFGGSPIRLRTLDRLCDGPATKAVLQEEIETSRITLWRLLSEFEDRGWIRETDSGYEATAAGRIVVERIDQMNYAFRAVDELGDLLEWLPLDTFDFPIERLADAEIARPSPTDPQRPMRLATRQIQEATEISILTHGYSPWVVETMYNRAIAGEQSGTMVTSTDVFEALDTQPPIRDQLRELIEVGALEYYHYEGDVPHIFAILDGEGLGMGVDDDSGRPQAALDIVDDQVLDWAERTFERYLDDATRVTPDRFTD